MPTVAGQIGPNAITQVAAVLLARWGARHTQRMFAAAGLAHHLTRPPQRMVDQADVRQLHITLEQELGPWDADQVAHAAGLATGDYLLAHRIPRLLQALLKRLPAPLAARVLLAAISRHAWTFVGSGRFVADRPGWRAGGVQVSIHANPLCSNRHRSAPACHFHAATFERLFATLVHSQARAREVSCEAAGGDACRFEIRWAAEAKGQAHRDLIQPAANSLEQVAVSR